MGPDGARGPAVRLYFQAGVFVYRRGIGFSQHYLDTCTKALDARFGFAHNAEHFTDQVRLGLSMFSAGLRWKQLPFDHNFPVASFLPPSDSPPPAVGGAHPPLPRLDGGVPVAGPARPARGGASRCPRLARDGAATRRPGSAGVALVREGLRVARASRGGATGCRCACQVMATLSPTSTTGIRPTTGPTTGRSGPVRGGNTRLMWTATILPRIRSSVPAGGGRSPGRGRFHHHLVELCDELTGIDISPVRQRRSSRFLRRFEVTPDGRSLPGVDDGTAGLVFLVPLVHVDSAAIRGYLSELARVLAPDGAAFLHYLNAATLQRAAGLSRDCCPPASHIPSPGAASCTT